MQCVYLAVLIITLTSKRRFGCTNVRIFLQSDVSKRWSFTSHSQVLPQAGYYATESGPAMWGRVCVCVLFFVLRKQRVIMCSNLRLWRLVEKDKATHGPFRPPPTAFCFLSITVQQCNRRLRWPRSHSAKCRLLALRKILQERAQKTRENFLEI